MNQFVETNEESQNNNHNHNQWIILFILVRSRGFEITVALVGTAWPPLPEIHDTLLEASPARRIG